MSAQLRLLDSDGSTPFVSHNFGNILAGAESVPKLVFAESYGDVDAEECEFGIEAVAGNDGYTFTEICQATEITASGITVTGTVSTSGGTIAAGADIAYKVTVADRWGNESAPCPAAFSPTFASGTTNKCDLSWTAVTDAFKYIIYSSISGGTFYKVGEASTNSFSDTTGTNDGVTVAPIGGNVAYAPGAWGTAAIDLGIIPIGNAEPLMVRNVIPIGTTSANNPRQHKCYVAFLAT